MRRVKALFDRLLWEEGSTRAVALIRLGYVPLLWDRFGSDFLLFRVDSALEAAVAVSFYVATPLLLLGLWTRLAAAWTAATMLTLFFGLGVHGGTEPYTHHHVWLLVVTGVLLALTPCGRSLSLDRAWWRYRAHGRGGRAPRERGPLFGQRLLAVQISVLYAWTTWDKLTPGFLSGERLQAILIDRYGSWHPPELPGFALFCLVGAVSTVVIEGALAVGLWVRRVQVPLMIVGALFHGVLFVMLPVATFSANMVLLYLTFLDPERVHRFVGGLLADEPEAGRASA